MALFSILDEEMNVEKHNISDWDLEIEYPIMVNLEDGDFVKGEVTANVVDKDEELSFEYENTDRVEDSSIL